MDVSWRLPDLIAGIAVLGAMSLTISDRASAVGDPLSQGGSTTTGILWLGNQIADIVFLGIG